MGARESHLLPGGDAPSASAAPCLDPLQAPSQEKVVSQLQDQVRALRDENKQLKQQNREKDEEISRLKCKLQTDEEKSNGWFSWWRGTSPPVKEFIIEFRTSGKTGGCEQKFLEEVSNLLSKQSISLKVEASTETSLKELLLLVFCPIASRIGTDIQNALEGLHGEQKAILVVMHFIPPDNTGTFLDTSRQGTHPAVVLTVHTRYTLQDGFYPCEMNATAVADVADAIKGFDEDTLREDSGAPTSTLFNMSWGGVIMGDAHYSSLCLSFCYLNRTAVPPLQAPASNLALDPPVQSSPLKVSCGGQGRPLGNQEEPGGGRCALDIPHLVSGDPLLKAEVAETPDALRQEGPGTMGTWRSHPLQKTKQKEVVSHHSETTEGVKEQGHVSQEEMEKVHAVQDKQDKISMGQIETCSQASDQNLSSETDPDGWLVVDLDSPPPKGLSQEELVSYHQEQVCWLTEHVSNLSAQNEQLRQQRRKKDEEISRLKQETTADEKSGSWFPWWRGTSPPVKDFTIKFRTSGKTGGCEQKFLEEVSNLLSEQSISLKVEESTETSSKDLLLLVFCPIASRMGTDIQNALEGLHGEQKAILVVMHFIPPDNTGTFLDTRQQGTHPALVLTVHTRYTLQDGFYPCEMNATAVVDVADAIKGFDEDTLREDSGASCVLLV